VQAYRRFLEWDIVKAPRSTRIADRILSPVMGKSVVFYARKPYESVRLAAPVAVTDAEDVAA